MKSSFTRIRGLLLAGLCALSLGAWPGARADEAPAQTAESARDAAFAALVRGPAQIELKDQARLSLPQGYGYIPRREAAALMRTLGNTVGDSFLGVVLPLDREHDHWFSVLVYEASGYVKDDDARNWRADELLKSLQEGTEAANAQRIAAGIPAMVVTRWIEPPAYDAATHRLVWSAEARNKEGATEDPTVNYNTYLLGREGYVSLNLVTAESTVEQDKVSARALLGNVAFNSGKDYASFNSSTDKVAAYGIAALVAGVAAKKLGLLALFGATIIKFGKLAAVAVVGAVAGVRKWLRARAARDGDPGDAGGSAA